MTNNPKHPLVSSFQTQAELELLQLILEEPASYPFNPYEADADAYFSALEQEVLTSGWSVEDLAEQGHILSERVNQLWETFSTPSATTNTLTSALLDRFAARAPQALIEEIVQRAQQVVSLNLSLADQLVQCVHDCLPKWGEEDLQVFARPLAFAMRAPETEDLDSTLQSIRSVSWMDLSDVEQARLSLMIARCAIAQVTVAESNASEE